MGLVFVRSIHKHETCDAFGVIRSEEADGEARLRGPTGPGDIGGRGTPFLAPGRL